MHLVQQPKTILARATRAQVSRCPPCPVAHINYDQQARVATLPSPQSLAPICCLINLPCSNSDEWSRCHSSCGVASHHLQTCKLSVTCGMSTLRSIETGLHIATQATLAAASAHELQRLPRPTPARTCLIPGYPGKSLAATKSSKRTKGNQSVGGTNWQPGTWEMLNAGRCWQSWPPACSGQRQSRQCPASASPLPSGRRCGACRTAPQ